MTRHVVHLDLVVRKGGHAHGIPVHQAFTTIDQPILEQTEERLTNGLRADGIHGESQSVPVAGTAHDLQLRDDGLFVLILPGLDLLDETFSGEIGATLALFEQSFLDHALCGDTGMIGARHPECGSPLHPLITCQYVLKGVVERVPEMQGGRHVGRGNQDADGFFATGLT